MGDAVGCYQRVSLLEGTTWYNRGQSETIPHEESEMRILLFAGLALAIGAATTATEPSGK